MTSPSFTGVCSDKVPPEDRLYVPSKEATAALQGGAPIVGRLELPASERSNAWTVALTAGGCIDYLNRKISPIGASTAVVCRKCLPFQPYNCTYASKLRWCLQRQHDFPGAVPTFNSAM